MRNQKPIQIHIPDPCAQDWAQMTPAEQGRFCAQCQKCVIDFTGYSDAALYQFFSKNTGHVCGRFLSTQLNRDIHIPPQPHSRLYRLFIGLGLVLVFTQAPGVKARPLSPVVIENAFCATEGDTHSDDSIELKILVLGDYNEPMIGTIIQLLNGPLVIGGGVADVGGNAVLKLSNEIDLSDVVIRCTYVAYETEIITLKKQNITKPIIVQMKMDKNVHLSGLISIQYKIPLIDKWDPEKHSISSEQIEKMPAR